MRLTIKDKCGYSLKCNLEKGMPNVKEHATKLGQYEDIEEKHNIKSFEDLDRRLTVLEIMIKYPKSIHHSLNYLLDMMKYWEKENKTITKKLLEIYDLPYEVEEYYVMKEYFYEKEN